MFTNNKTVPRLKRKKPTKVVMCCFTVFFLPPALAVMSVSLKVMFTDL